MAVGSKIGRIDGCEIGEANAEIVPATTARNGTVGMIYMMFTRIFGGVGKKGNIELLRRGICSALSRRRVATLGCLSPKTELIY